MELWLCLILLPCALLVLLFFYVIYIYNRLITLKTRVEETLKQIDVRLQNRYDLLPDLIEAVEKAVATDKEIQTKIAELRSALQNAKATDIHDLNNKNKFELDISNALRGIQIFVEAYPDLKSHQAIQYFMSENTSIEEKIAAARQIYNVTAREYNESIQVFPNSIIANMFNHKPVEYWESSPEARKDIKPQWSGQYKQDE